MYRACIFQVVTIVKKSMVTFVNFNFKSVCLIIPDIKMIPLLADTLT